MSQTIIAVILSISVIYIVEAQLIRPGPCPDFKPFISNSSEEGFAVWYEFARYPTPSYVLEKCITVYLDGYSNGDVLIEKTGFFDTYEKEIRVSGLALADSPGIMRFGPEGLSGLHQSAQITALGGDGENYSVNFICSEMDDNHAEYIYIITSEPQPSQKVIDEALSDIKAYGLDVDNLTYTDQTDCPPSQ